MRRRLVQVLGPVRALRAAQAVARHPKQPRPVIASSARRNSSGVEVLAFRTSSTSPFTFRKYRALPRDLLPVETTGSYGERSARI